MNLASLKYNVRKAGFTLIELMVAIGVTALLVSLMLTITINVLSGWNRSSGSLTAGNQARTVLDMLSRDLQAAVMKKDGNIWLAASIQPDQTGTGDAKVTGASWDNTSKPSISPVATSATDTSGSLYLTSNLEDCRFGQAGTWLRFFTSATDSNTSTATLSAPRAVSYQIVRLPVVAGSSEYRYQLFRSEVSSSATFTAGYRITAAPYISTTETADLVGAGVIRNPEISTPNRSLVLANNVVDFGLKFYIRERDPTWNPSSVPKTDEVALRLIFPAKGVAGPDRLTGAPNAPLKGTLTAQSSGTEISHYATGIAPSSTDSSYDSDYYSTAAPDVVEIMVRVLTDEGVTQLALFENPPSGYVAPPGTTWWDIVLKNSKVYTRRIELKATGL
jgi:prepilin-type N-terminal cleavage/methylation domain-containing protein